jgi:hypothetical protein
MDEPNIFAVHIAIIQLTHQMSMKSTHKNLMGFELLMYEQLCGFTQEYTKMLRVTVQRSKDEGSSKTEGGSSQSGT